MVVVLRLWLKLSKPYLGLTTQIGNRWFSSCQALTLSHIRRYHLRKIITLLERDVTGGRKWTQQNPIPGQYKTQFPLSVSQHDAIESFDSLCNQRNTREAVEVLDYLENKGYAMDLNRLLRLAKLCSESEALEEAKVVHEYVFALVSSSDVSSRNAIIEMYSGCGSLDDARKVFDEMLVMSSETWYVMMRCFANNGSVDDALKCLMKCLRRI
ncbi:unnamed protein product [Arabis nemorensis]|uniref:Pentacotripeptide-repeat region of PRORP domain-containing protein n=1 Tax=Arabis nemorensis TaxID=586526 RepID=A0A565AUE3_9BRAS|nr:unnamed protein product [Arabis nemorensis]